MDRAELSEEILKSIDQLLVDRERFDGSLDHLAVQCDKLANRIVDEAAADCFTDLVSRVGKTPDRAALAPLIAFKAFVADVGSLKFETALLKSIHGLKKDLADIDSTLELRLQIYALLNVIGHPIPAVELEAETKLRQTRPLGWLDLSVNQFAPQKFVAAVSHLLVDQLIEAKSLLQYVPVIMKNYSAGTVQAVLDQCCAHLYQEARYSEAESLVADFELIEPQGWLQPLGIIDTNIARDTSPVIFAENVLKQVDAGQTDPISGLEDIRAYFEPILAVEAGKDDGGAPDIIVHRMQKSRGKLVYAVAAHLDEFKQEDADGRDWFRDNSAWREVTFSKRDFKRIATYLLESPNAKPPSRLASTKSGRLELQQAAAAAGF